MKKFDFAIAPKELAETMLRDLGNGPASINGDRSSGYFLVAKGEETDGEITAALIENKAFLKPADQFYSIHLINNITMADCELICTKDLGWRSLVHTIDEMYSSIEHDLK